MSHRFLFAPLAVAALLLACHDVSSFSTASGGYYEGAVVTGSFVRAGLGDSRMCLSIDTSHLQDAPGAISTSDGLFHATTLRPIPQFWQDPLSTFTFGEGRIQNVLYVASGNPFDSGVSGEGSAEAGAPGVGGDVFVVISFMVAGGIEVRLLRGAPAVAGAGPLPAGPPNLFGVFTLNRANGTCPF